MFYYQANEKEVVVVGRIFGLIMIGLSIAWLPILQVMQGSQLWDYLQSISSYITPPWVVVFLLGMFWKRCTEQVNLSFSDKEFCQIDTSVRFATSDRIAYREK